MKDYVQVIRFLKEKYEINNISFQDFIYKLYALKSGKDKIYIVFKDGISSNSELTNVYSFVDECIKRGHKNASYLFIAFTNEDWRKESYLSFNGNSFLHVVTNNLDTNNCLWDSNFYYWGCKRLKQLIKEIVLFLQGANGAVLPSPEQNNENGSSESNLDN